MTNTPTGTGGPDRSAAIQTACAHCNSAVLLQVRGRTARTANGARSTISYADTDIVVWDCPTCHATNADALNE